ncbi:hypothetical protein ACOME3_005718 [Neoechinorhynchus agilis]
MISGDSGKDDLFNRQQRIIELFTAKQLEQEKEVKELKEKLEEIARRDAVPVANVIPFRSFTEGSCRRLQILSKEIETEEQALSERLTDNVVLHTPHGSVRSVALQMGNLSFEMFQEIALKFEATTKAMELIPKPAAEIDKHV